MIGCLFLPFQVLGAIFKIATGDRWGKIGVSVFLLLLAFIFGISQYGNYRERLALEESEKARNERIRQLQRVTIEPLSVGKLITAEKAVPVNLRFREKRNVVQIPADIPFVGGKVLYEGYSDIRVDGMGVCQAGLDLEKRPAVFTNRVVGEAGNERVEMTVELLEPQFFDCYPEKPLELSEGGHTIGANNLSLDQVNEATKAGMAIIERDGRTPQLLQKSKENAETMWLAWINNQLAALGTPGNGKVEWIKP